MSGFASYQGILDKLNSSLEQRSIGLKQQSMTAATGVGFAAWQSASGGLAGAVPTLGLAGATACDSSTAGAMPLISAGSNKLHLLSATMRESSTGLQTFILVDRLAHAQVAVSQANGSFSPAIDATARLASGEGGLIMVEVSSALGTGTNTFNMTYTNQAGTGSRTTADMTTVASSALNNSPFAAGLYMPLQAGDKGVRSIEGWTLTSGSQTGNIIISIVKPLAWLVTPISTFTYERNYIFESVSLPLVHNAACLHWAGFWVGGGSGTVTFVTDLKLLVG